MYHPKSLDTKITDAKTLDDLLLDRHIEAIHLGTYGNTDHGHDHFPAEVQTQEQKRAHVLANNPDLMEALRYAYHEDAQNSFLPQATRRQYEYLGTLAPTPIDKSRA